MTPRADTVDAGYVESLEAYTIRISKEGVR